MKYPSISEYVEAIRSAKNNFDKLNYLRPVLDNSGNPIISNGDFAIIFKMKNENDGKYYALKCFTKVREEYSENYKQIEEELELLQSTYLVKVKYYNKELFVKTQNTNENKFPVLLMDWIDGTTLNKYIRQNINDNYALAKLTYNFSRMAMWLLPKPFAHGDLKPDNILVRSDGSLTLVDYDNMYVPSMRGQKACELGDPDFRHPLRTKDDFNERIDDFPAISILLSLRLIVSDPSLLTQYETENRLLFSESNYRNFSSCTLLKSIFPSQDTDINTLVSLFTIANICKTLSNISFTLLQIEIPKETKIEIPSTKVTEKDLTYPNIRFDKRCFYSKDGKRLIKGTGNWLTECKIKEGTKVICNEAFINYKSLKRIIIPTSVTSIGNRAFLGCSSLQRIEISENVINIGSGAFSKCNSLLEIVISKSVTNIGSYAFRWCNSLQRIIIPDNISNIGDYTFSNCRSLQEIIIPKNVTNIGSYAFECCKSLQRIVIPENVTSIGDHAFLDCWSLQEIVIPKSVTNIGRSAFSGCNSLQRIVIPENVTSIGDHAFSDCWSLQEIVIPKSVTNIGRSAFSGCNSLQRIVIPENTTNIGDYLFLKCESLQEIIIPVGVTNIGRSAFEGCRSLQKITIPSNVINIGDSAFRYCI